MSQRRRKILGFTATERTCHRFFLPCLDTALPFTFTIAFIVERYNMMPMMPSQSWHQRAGFLRGWKRSVRIGLKYVSNLRRGYPFAFAHRQVAAPVDSYPHVWFESVTPIPDRGSADIRKNRIYNLQRATDRIHQLQMDPGNVFSFCHLVGDPSLRNGYRAGAVFVGGKVQTGAGGGLCLIATNLFHLFLNAGCEILERHAHSIDAYGRDRFYTLGQDASIAYGYKDLIVRNQSDIPLLLSLQVLPDSGQVISRLQGQQPCPWQVKVESVVLQELKSPLPNGISGWRVETRRTSPSRANQLDYTTLSLYKSCEDSKPQKVMAM